MVLARKKTEDYGFKSGDYLHSAAIGNAVFQQFLELIEWNAEY